MNMTAEAIKEEAFKDAVEQEFGGQLFSIGNDKAGNELFLEYDFNSVAYDPQQKRWRVGALFFQVVDAISG